MDPDEKRLRLRARFEEVADLYARVRPSYPPGVFDDIWSVARLGDAPHVLEIGCGSGQSTMPLLERGARVLALELGPRLAEHARARTQAHASRVTIETIDFDTWTPPESRFDLVYSATAFHWLDPATRWASVARALRGGGHVAVVSNVHVSDERGDAFYRRSQVGYAEAFGAGAKDLPRSDALVPVAVDTRLFELVRHRVHPWVQTFDAKAYLETLATYSDHRDLDAAVRERLFDRLAGIIDDEFGGRIEKHWAATVTIAQLSRSARG